MSLRVCQLNTVYNGGGIDNQTTELASGLAARHHDVLLVLRSGCDWEPMARARDLNIALLPWQGWRKPLRALLVARILRQQKTQIIHAHHGRDYWHAILAARLAGIGTHVIITRHLMTRPAGLSRAALLRCAHVVAVSRAVLGVLEKELHGPKARLHQIYCGIDAASFHLEACGSGRAFRLKQGWSDDSVVFGIVGRYGLPGGKGHLIFVEACARIKQEFPQARFVIVGEGGLGPTLRECITVLNLEKETTMIPFTPNMPPIMNALDVLVHPAIGSDSFPLVVLEAMAAGKPVLASALDGIPEQFQHGIQGLLVPPRDLEALVEGMRQLLRKPQLRSQMGVAGRKHVTSSFTSDRQTERYINLYERICAR